MLFFRCAGLFSVVFTYLLWPLCRRGPGDGFRFPLGGCLCRWRFDSPGILLSVCLPFHFSWADQVFLRRLLFFLFRSDFLFFFFYYLVLALGTLGCLPFKSVTSRFPMQSVDFAVLCIDCRRASPLYFLFSLRLVYFCSIASFFFLRDVRDLYGFRLTDRR